MKRILSQNPEFKKTTYFHADADHVRIETVQDVESIVEANKSVFNSTDERARWGEWQRVAHIPLVVLNDLKQKKIADDPIAMKKWLNDPDNRAFRTRPGRV